MARIAVVTSHPPFAEGGHLVIARALTDALRGLGHQADITLTPQNRFGRQASAYLSTWLTDLGQAHDGCPIDQVISFRFPSYAVRHARHVCWLNHRMREYYDQWPQFSAQLSYRARFKERVRRELIHSADHYFLTRNVSRLFSQSRTVQERLIRWGRISSEVLHPPAPPRPYRCDGYDDYFLVASRLTPLKRIDLLVQALAEPAASGVRCVIVGDGEARSSIEARIEVLGLGERVSLLGRVDDSTLIEHLARCRFVCCPSEQEDYGLVTAEAFSSAKAVITCTDSGGHAELVEHGATGLLVEPSKQALAGALGRLMDDVATAERWGQLARRKAETMTWEDTVDQLLLV